MLILGVVASSPYGSTADLVLPDPNVIIDHEGTTLCTHEGYDIEYVEYEPVFSFGEFSGPASQWSDQTNAMLISDVAEGLWARAAGNVNLLSQYGPKVYAEFQIDYATFTDGNNDGSPVEPINWHEHKLHAGIATRRIDGNSNLVMRSSNYDTDDAATLLADDFLVAVCSKYSHDYSFSTYYMHGNTYGDVDTVNNHGLTTEIFSQSGTESGGSHYSWQTGKTLMVALDVSNAVGALNSDTGWVQSWWGIDGHWVNGDPERGWGGTREVFTTDQNNQNPYYGKSLTTDVGASVFIEASSSSGAPNGQYSGVMRALGNRDAPFIHTPPPGFNDQAELPTPSEDDSAYQVMVLADSPVAYYPMTAVNQSVTNVDVTNNGYDLINTNVNVAELPITASGRSHKFNGDTSYATGNTTDLAALSFPCSVECWFKVFGIQAESSADLVATHWQSGVHSGFRMGVTNDGAVFAGTGEGVDFTDSSRQLVFTQQDVILENTNYHVLVEYVDINTTNIYVNGALMTIGTSLGTGSSVGQAGKISIGATLYTSPVRPFNGWIDHVAIYDKLLTAQERVDRVNRGHFNTLTPEPTDYQDEVLLDTPLAYYPLTDVDATLETSLDISGNGEHLSHVRAAKGQPPQIVEGASYRFHSERFDRLVQTTNPWPSLTYPVTLECWIEPDHWQHPRAALISTHDRADAYNGFNIFIYEYGDIVTLVGDGTGVSEPDRRSTSYQRVVAAGERSHVVATFTDANTRQLWINGTEVTDGVASGSGGSPSTASGDYLSIGRNRRDDDDHGYYNGAISHVAIYDTILSSSRIIAHYIEGVSI